MSMVLTNFICSTIISVMGLIVVKHISGCKEKLLSLKSLLLMVLLIIIPVFIRTEEYGYLYTIIVYTMTIFVYKEILNISIIKSIISCGIMLLTLLLLDVLLGAILTNFIPINEVRKLWYSNLIINIAFSTISIIIFKNKAVSSKLPALVEKISNKKAIKIVLALILVLIAMFIILYTLTRQISINKIFTSNFLLFLVFFLLIVLLLGERNNYENLSEEYDNLFNYVQIFEDWIEKEQLTRHEYKNQLAILRMMTKEKKVKNKIDSIVEDFIEIDNQMISKLKFLPNGGLKGLLYYKMATATKDKININMDIEDSVGKLFSKLSDEQVKTLTTLVGIYTDNAIEAANETTKKLVTIEIYKLKQSVKIVISNSYNIDKDISNRYQKGVSTKGKGRGNGLYFANKLISKNNWLKETHKLTDGFYIQEILINI